MSTAKLKTQFEHYERISQVIDYLDERYTEHPPLAEMARKAGLSKAHFQRIFSEYVGISPKKYMHVLSADALKARLLHGESVLEATFSEGLSSTSRTHELLIKSEAVQPGQVRQAGKDLICDYGVAITPFGYGLFVISQYGLFHLSFGKKDELEMALEELKNTFNQASWTLNESKATEWSERIFSSKELTDPKPLHIHLRGTSFQLKVWQALLTIPEHFCLTYGHLAIMIGKEGASRAVGTAVGANRIAWIVPCHRVIRQNGIIGQYRWGRNRKKIMLAQESIYKHQ